jgi:uncharacterized membrane protein
MNPLSGTLSQAWEIYKAHWKHFAAISLVVYGVIALISLFLTAIGGLIGALLAAIISVIGTFLVQAALVKAVEDVRDGRADMTLGETYSAVKPSIAPVAGASILAGLGIGIGLLLLIVPGLILMTIWFFIIPAIVIERVGAMGSFARSREIVSGHGMQVFTLIVLTFLVQLAFGIILGIVLLPLPEAARGFASQLLSGGLVGPYVAVAWTLAYFRLRQLKEGQGHPGVPPGTPPPPAPPPYA